MPKSNSCPRTNLTRKRTRETKRSVSCACVTSRLCSRCAYYRAPTNSTRNASTNGLNRTERVQYAVAMPDNILETPVPVATDAKLLKCTSANCHGSQGRYFAQSYQPSGCWFVQISVDEHFSRTEEAGNKDDRAELRSKPTAEPSVSATTLQPEDYKNRRTIKNKR